MQVYKCVRVILMKIAFHQLMGILVSIQSNVFVLLK